MLFAATHRGVNLAALDAALAKLGVAPSQITIVGVANPSRIAATFAPMTGAVNTHQLLASALLDVAEAARRCAMMAGDGVSIRHCGVESWREVFQLTTQHDLLVVGTQLRWRDRKRLAVAIQNAPAMFVPSSVAV